MQIACLTEDKGLIERLCTLFGKESIIVFASSRKMQMKDVASCDLLLVDLNFSKIPVIKDSQLHIVALTLIPKFEEAVVLLKAGVRGYGNSRMQPSNLEQLITTVAAGQLWMPPEILVQLIGQLDTGGQPKKQPALFNGLSKREKEVAEYVEKGLTNQKIADKMYVTPRTVKAHLSSIYEKTGIKNRLELAVKMKEKV